MKYPKPGFIKKKCIEIKYTGRTGDGSIEMEYDKATSEAYNETLILEGTPITQAHLDMCKVFERLDKIKIIAPIINFNASVARSSG